ncbi:hypothetical protein H4582DRAFT_1179182 [Lactarius indigo]|nr:hypothetical protein H4582DRAFT_1179182 [Lactarius indigo]
MAWGLFVFVLTHRVRGSVEYTGTEDLWGRQARDDIPHWLDILFVVALRCSYPVPFEYYRYPASSQDGIYYSEDCDQEHRPMPSYSSLPAASYINLFGSQCPCNTVCVFKPLLKLHRSQVGKGQANHHHHAGELVR